MKKGFFNHTDTVVDGGNYWMRTPHGRYRFPATRSSSLL